MKTNFPSVFIDSSQLKALIDPTDDFHLSATTLWSKLQKENTKLITTNYILDESFTLIRKKCGLEQTVRLRQFLVNSLTQLKIVRVTVTDEAEAWSWFLKDWSNLSFTDCVSFAVMKRLNLTRVAAFDNHFARAGFKIAG